MTAATSAPGVPARAAALKLLDAVLRRGLPLESALDAAARGLDRPEDRALAHLLAATVLRHLPDLDALIDGATAKPLAPDAKARSVLRLALAQALRLGTPPHAAIATVLPLVDGGPRRLVHGVFGTLSRRETRLPDPPRLPPAVEERWTAQWGAEVVAAARIAGTAPPPLDLTLRDPAETGLWAERLGATSLAPGHLRLPAGARVADLPGFADGAWWVQDLAASLPVRLLGPGNGARAIDLCAAPGGKLLQLAAAGWDTDAIDLAEPRLARVRENLARTRLSARVRVADALTFTADGPAQAVLLDAPCSATGIFRRHPDVLHRVRSRAIERLAEAQRAMLARAAQWVVPGGTLLYATCSLERAEGEEVADAFLTAQGGFAADPVRADELPDGIAPDAAGHVRVLPGAWAAAGGADGFFVARFRRR
jgi:16S rRNA (cytosine967-C5)-methyltransferase